LNLPSILLATLFAPCLAAAQTLAPANDASLTNLQTPVLLGQGKSALSLDFRYFGGYDKTVNSSVWYGFGFCKDWEIDFAGTFDKWSSMTSGAGTEIRFGGTDEEISVRYRVPFTLPLTIQGGLADPQTPAQNGRLASTAGVSLGYSPESRIRFYVNPKSVFLQDNTIFGVSVGGAIDLVPNITLIGDFTHIFAGDNTIDTGSGNTSRSHIYSIGLRFPNLVMNGSLDLGVTNGSGITTGSSLTPSLGGAPAVFARLSYRF
jgi:hypothetical protein